MFRKCDRYWYETSDPKIRFSEQQLQVDIKKLFDRYLV